MFLGVATFGILFLVLSVAVLQSVRAQGPRGFSCADFTEGRPRRGAFDRDGARQYRAGGGAGSSQVGSPERLSIAIVKGKSARLASTRIEVADPAGAPAAARTSLIWNHSRGPHVRSIDPRSFPAASRTRNVTTASPGCDVHGGPLSTNFQRVQLDLAGKNHDVIFIQMEAYVDKDAS